MTAAASGRRMARWAPVAIAVAGLAVVARHAGQGLWLDEIWLARWLRDGVVPATPVPPLFVLLGRLAVAAFGSGEVALRLPALAGYALLAALPAALPGGEGALFARRFAPLWSVLLAACSPIAFYAVQLKPYTWEAALATALLVAWLRFDADPESPAAASWLVALAAAAPLGMVPAPFVVVPVLAAAWLVAGRLGDSARRVKARRRIAAAGGAAALIFVLVMAGGASFVAGRADPRLKEYWAPLFWDGSPGFVLEQSRRWLGQVLNLTRAGLVLLVLSLLFGVVAAAGRRRRRALFAGVCLVPIALALAASRAGQYPYGETRLLLFAAPGVLALIAAGLAELAARARPIGGLLAAAILVVHSFRGLVRETYDSSYMRLVDARDANATIARLWRPGTAIVARSDFAAQLAWYRPELVASLRSPGEAGDAKAGEPPAGRRIEVELAAGARAYTVTVRESP